MNRWRDIDPIIDERWKAGTYVRSGIYFLPGRNLCPSQIPVDSMAIYREVRRMTKGVWPRPISGYFSIPVYVDTDFSADATEWVKRRQPLKWAIWQEPLLYSLRDRSVTMRVEYGNFGCAFFGYLGERIALALEVLGEEMGECRESLS